MLFTLFPLSNVNRRTLELVLEEKREKVAEDRRKSMLLSQALVLQEMNRVWALFPSVLRLASFAYAGNFSQGQRGVLNCSKEMTLPE